MACTREGFLHMCHDAPLVLSASFFLFPCVYLFRLLYILFYARTPARQRTKTRRRKRRRRNETCKYLLRQVTSLSHFWLLSQASFATVLLLPCLSSLVICVTHPLVCVNISLPTHIMLCTLMPHAPHRWYRQSWWRAPSSSSSSSPILPVCPPYLLNHFRQSLASRAHVSELYRDSSVRTRTRICSSSPRFLHSLNTHKRRLLREKYAPLVRSNMTVMNGISSGLSLPSTISVKVSSTFRPHPEKVVRMRACEK